MIIAIAFHDTIESKTETSKRCLESLRETVDLSKHRLFLIDNNSCEETKKYLHYFSQHQPCTIITNKENIGTAEAVNLAWKKRGAFEHCMKIDNDVVWHQKGWVELMNEAIELDNNIGIIGLKRKDCWENTSHEDPQYKSKLIQLPHTAGQKWITVEQCKHIIGTCQMYNYRLLDKIGYLYQPSLYGYDDVLASYRSEIAGFKNVFLPHIEIDHIDNGGTEYQSWKERHAGEQTQNVINIVNEYINGSKSIYHNPYES